MKYEQDLDACLTNFRYYINQQLTRVFKHAVSWAQEQATALVLQVLPLYIKSYSTSDLPTCRCQRSL